MRDDTSIENAPIEYAYDHGIMEPVRTLVPYGPSVVYAPPAFKGQKSAKGATKARFAYIAERLAKAQTK